jgi:hypothetical protein
LTYHAFVRPRFKRHFKLSLGTFYLTFLTLSHSLSKTPATFLTPLLICTWFLKYLVHEIDFWTWFLSISNLIFTDCVACKNQVRKRQKIKFKNQVRRDFKNQVQINKGLKYVLLPWKDKFTIVTSFSIECRNNWFSVKNLNDGQFLNFYSKY